jgi:hypothetical protein
LSGKSRLLDSVIIFGADAQLRVALSIASDLGGIAAFYLWWRLPAVTCILASITETDLGWNDVTVSKTFPCAHTTKVWVTLIGSSFPRESSFVWIMFALPADHQQPDACA